MAGEVAVVVVLPAARGRTRVGDMRTDEIKFRLVGRFAERLAVSALPFQFQPRRAETVRALQRGGEYVLVRIAQARAAALLVDHVAHLLLFHVHVSAIPRQLMRRGGFIVKLGVGGGARLGRAVRAELRAVNCLARQIISLSLLASVGMLIAEGCHYAPLAVEKAVAVTHACVEIGAGGGVLHVQIVCCEVVGSDAVRLGAALHLIGRLLVGIAPAKRSEVAV